MDKINEKKAFSERLKSSLENLNYSCGPTFLCREFNLRYSGSPISTQTAHNWLNGNAIPSQEKLQILAVWLQVSSEWLRFGQQSSEFSGSQHMYLSSIDAKFQRLAPKQQKLIMDLIDSLL